MSTVARHRTAMTRSALSRPIATAVADGVLDPSMTVFDYGCGRGDDVRNLTAIGYGVLGWDPAHRPHAERIASDVVNLGYVVNVIEHPDERAETLRAAWALARRLLVVSSRLTWDARDLSGRPLADGLITRTGTFQKFYEQAELRGWIEQTLGVQPIAAAPGIFYVFRDPTDVEQFLAARVYTNRPRVQIDPHESYDAHRELLAPLMAFMRDHARQPRAGELVDQQATGIREVFGSNARAIRLIRQVTEDTYWDRVSAQRRGELLLYIAMSRFRRRPRLSQLSASLATDIKAMFGTYNSACIQADRLLLACGDPAMILVSARSSKVGKQTPSALYVHRSALQELPLVLQVYVACAQILTGTIDQANLIKLSVQQPQVSFLSYPSFDRDPHPALVSAMTVNLKRLSIDWRDYRTSDNPPLLHRKEEFLGKVDPRRQLYERLTRAEVRAGLYERPEVIGTRNGWRLTLASAGVTVRGHRLVRDASTPK
ncbi:DNA phosphorothioation-associated putative methyltransferase [Nakamurella panacisegetis]|uniref:DNA phosphorothioation-associated putative methyltransferase n=1 Tax=Nakamurella panacisegetis TaxID=1090615 RepID=A0A1H0IU26_9ACTN|nr:DNA phosphorothioation-associated putative methyltransferase [Nakamurella panacisegetis]SDO34551.1 DNA phosphorothioation-associated putative methyltransferase [Nakamurella panacisegetis]